MALQKKISLKKNKSKIGKIYEVLVEGPSPESPLLLQGRFFGQAPDIDGVVLINEGKANIGETVSVEIVDVSHYDLVGKIVS